MKIQRSRVRNRARLDSEFTNRGLATQSAKVVNWRPRERRRSRCWRGVKWIPVHCEGHRRWPRITKRSWAAATLPLPVPTLPLYLHYRERAKSIGLFQIPGRAMRFAGLVPGLSHEWKRVRQDRWWGRAAFRNGLVYNRDVSNPTWARVPRRTRARLRHEDERPQDSRPFRYHSWKKSRVILGTSSRNQRDPEDGKKKRTDENSVTVRGKGRELEMRWHERRV